MGVWGNQDSTLPTIHPPIHPYSSEIRGTTLEEVMNVRRPNQLRCCVIEPAGPGERATVSSALPRSST